MGFLTTVKQIVENQVGLGAIRGHPNNVSFPSGLKNAVGLGNPLKSLVRSVIQDVGVYHDEGGQVVILRGEFFGRYRVSIGTQEMFDNGLQVICYSGIAGEGQRCVPYARQRRLSFVMPMGLPLGTVNIMAEALEAQQSPIRATLSVVKRPLYGRLYTIARSFPDCYSTEVANSMREAKVYD